MSNLETGLKFKRGDKAATTGISDRYSLEDVTNEGEELVDFPQDESWYISPTKEHQNKGLNLAFKYSIENSAFDVLPNQRRGESIAYPKDKHTMSKTPGPLRHGNEVSNSFHNSSSSFAEEDLLNEQHLASFMGHKPSSSSPDVMGIVSHLWGQSPAVGTDRTHLALGQAPNEQGSGSPISKRYFDAFCAPLLTTETTPVFDHLKEELITALVDDENFVNVNRNLFVSDLSVNAPSWPGTTYFDNKAAAVQPLAPPVAVPSSLSTSSSDVLASAFERNKQQQHGTATHYNDDQLYSPKQSTSAPIFIPRRGGVSPPPRTSGSSSIFNNDNDNNNSNHGSGFSSSVDGSAFLRPKPSQERAIFRNSFDLPSSSFVHRGDNKSQQQQQTAANRIAHASRHSHNNNSHGSLSLDIDLRRSNDTYNNNNHLRGSHDSNGSDKSSYYQPPHHHSTAVKVVNSSSVGHISSLDFIESPRSKHAFKEFMTTFRIKTKESASTAEEYALKLVTSSAMPEHARWRVYVELAELAKKSNDYQKAREWYIQACVSERRAASTWLEWSKMEEENGHLILAIKVLNFGVIICKLNETLLPRMIKLRERLHQYSHVRDVLSVLKYESLERAWRSILEGSLFEARIGHSEVAKEIFKYLIRHVPWYGPIYFDAYRLEEREQRDEEALKIIHRGLHELPRYGPLWFGLIHITERLDQKLELRLWQEGIPPHLPQVQLQCHEAIRSISKELTWRVHYERFCIEERAMEIVAFGRFNTTNSLSLLQYRREMAHTCRHSLTQALLLCANNIRWKIFLLGARFELGLSNNQASKVLLQRALLEVPSKSRSSVIIECSRHEEYLGNAHIARRIMYKARNENISDWRVFLESILLELRSGELMNAIRLAKVSVRNHPGTGRVWALCIQLYHRWEGIQWLYNNADAEEALRDEDGGEMSLSLSLSQSLSLPLSQSVTKSQKSLSSSLKEMAIRQAIHEVPKSGEVWCEQGRCRFNPLLLDDFDLQLAQMSFIFAMQFTPQFGDTFVEYQRLELLCRSCLREVCNEVLKVDFAKFVRCFLSRDQDGDLLPWISTLSADNNKVDKAEREKKIAMVLRLQPISEEVDRERIQKLTALEEDAYPQLLRRCGNADPNYGPLWFHCHRHPEDIPLLVMQRARTILLHELCDSYPLYLRAVLCFVVRMIDRACQLYQQQQDQQEAKPSGVDEDSQFIDDDARYQEMQELLHEYNLAVEVWLHEEDSQQQEQRSSPFVAVPDGEMFAVADFVTGIVEVNRVITGFAQGRVSDEMRRRFLFGVDQIV